jgi:FKBP-type peptidyl-prolyl cis-trans isomerase
MLAQLATIVDQKTHLPAHQFNDNTSMASQDSIQSHYTSQSIEEAIQKSRHQAPSTKHSPEKKKQKSTSKECSDTTTNEQSKMETSSISDNNISTTQDGKKNHESDSDQSEVQYKYPPLPDGGDSE